ncbi:hypothetical protein [Bradyrhizobium sp. CCGUVB23]|uniref:hypothetical protein n=1 Tax=Bradyrhizobium sp. CCGUVB23 TaxID=2949630 RepID=UPI0020B30AEE|nr:hypothetical protein [Bradyrhizobium sp. CCGUVB23]MCP3463499.1 hypothetical protein [Bradyrhizobium sp. CCGUVB23]
MLQCEAQIGIRASPIAGAESRSRPVPWLPSIRRLLCDGIGAAQALQRVHRNFEEPGCRARATAPRYTHEFEMIVPGQLVAIEALYPNDFDFINKERKPRSDNSWITSVRDKRRDIRDRFCEWIENYIEKKNEPALDWLVQEFRAHYIRSSPMRSPQA